jgi:hypothetical protein
VPYGVKALLSFDLREMYLRKIVDVDKTPELTRERTSYIILPMMAPVRTVCMENVSQPHAALVSNCMSSAAFRLCDEGLR